MIGMRLVTAPHSCPPDAPTVSPGFTVSPLRRWLPILALVIATALLIVTQAAAEPGHIALVIAGLIVGLLAGVSVGLEWATRRLR